MAKLKGNNEVADNAQCKARLSAVADALYAIGGKWKLRIIIALTDGNKRFNELQRLVEGISAKMLSNELKELELNGFINRNVFASTPVTVEYELSEYAETLSGVLQSLSEWATIFYVAGNGIRKNPKRILGQPITWFYQKRG